MFNQFYAKYREIILFNKNIIIAAIASIIADALVVQYSVERITDNSVVVSILSILTDTGVYLATFAAMFLIDNRNKYVDTETGKKDSARFKRDVKRVITALGVSEVVYMIVKFTSIYVVLQLNAVPPYQAAMFTTLLAWIFYVITANVIMMRFRKLSR
ncbi:MAG TPA: hypothetical protein VF172_01280 [Nitrososphaera sp.]